MKFLVLALALPSMAFAFKATPERDCSPLDLRNYTLGQVRNQKDVAWCYAFTGADMLAHAYDKSEKISAADIAIRYNETKLGLFAHWMSTNIIKRNDPEYTRSAHQTGFNKVALDKTMKDGWCPESVLPSEAWTKVTRSPAGETSAEVPLAQAMLEISALHDIRGSLTPANLPYYYKFKNVDAAKFIELLQTKKVNSFYFGLRQVACKDDRHEFSQTFKTKMVIKNPWIFNRVNEQLEDGHLVGLDYDSRIYPNADHRKMSFGELHTSPIVARRWNSSKNSCEYLIRNSYGEDCNNGRYDSRHDCQDGQIWLNQAQIYKTMTSIVYILSK